MSTGGMAVTTPAARACIKTTEGHYLWCYVVDITVEVDDQVTHGLRTVYGETITATIVHDLQGFEVQIKAWAQTPWALADAELTAADRQARDTAERHRQAEQRKLTVAREQSAALDRAENLRKVVELNKGSELLAGLSYDLLVDLLAEHRPRTEQGGEPECRTCSEHYDSEWAAWPCPVIETIENHLTQKGL